MADIRRASRADRRRRSNPAYDGPERRTGQVHAVKVYSQIHNDEMQVFVQNPIISDNLSSAREELSKHSQRSRTLPVIVDLQKTTYVDTPGLSVLLELRRELTAQGRQLIIQNPSRSVLRMLNITRMNRVFTLRTTANADTVPIPGAVTKRPDGTPLPPEDSPLGALAGSSSTRNQPPSNPE